MIDYKTIANDLGLYILRDALCTYELFREPAAGIGLHWQVGISNSVNGWASQISDRKQIYITSLAWHHDKSQFSRQAEFVSSFSSNVDEWDPKDHFVILCNEEEEVQWAQEAGFRRAFLCNQSCFLDWNLYALEDRAEHERLFNLVINNRPEKWKRPHFAAGIERLAVIQGKNFRPNEYFDLKSLNPWFINEDRLLPREVVTLLGLSKVGGAFSAIEGVCFSSSEYLLCGLPVVSTPSKGGRAIWYDSDNSIIVEKPEEVPSAVASLIGRCKRQPELRTEIRARHIEKSKEMRAELFRRLNAIAHEFGLHIEFESIFRQHYVNKMRRFLPMPTKN